VVVESSAGKIRGEVSLYIKGKANSVKWDTVAGQRRYRVSSPDKECPPATLQFGPHRIVSPLYPGDRLILYVKSARDGKDLSR
jgi:hypothetical protein